jgi:D-glycero-alpha-D-manno-heptose-7-phosphate kinase
MIICKTPYRISFFGGGTDFPAWYEENMGQVLSTTIDKYSYLTCRILPPFFSYKYRVRYYKREEVNYIKDIQHPSIRECLKFAEIDQGVDIVHHGDLPAQSGLGTSSTFTVGLLHALNALNHRNPSKKKLSLDALYIEQNVLRENVGSQDQIAAAFGGFNLIKFKGKEEFDVYPLKIGTKERLYFESHLLLFFTGLLRNSSDIAIDQLKRISQNTILLKEMHSLVDEAIKSIFSFQDNTKLFGELLDSQWRIKRSMSESITNSVIDQIYETGMMSGAIGGKLLGAGGGGFMLFFAKPECHKHIIDSLNKLLHVPFKFESNGSQIIYNSNNENH